MLHRQRRQRPPGKGIDENAKIFVKGRRANRVHGAVEHEFTLADQDGENSVTRLLQRIGHRITVPTRILTVPPSSQGVR